MTKIYIFTIITMAAFAANSILCRLALHHTAMDAATFTAIRLVSGALVLWLIAPRHESKSISWRPSFALFIYAVTFSFAYKNLTAATGALLLFGAVQVTMISAGLRFGEKMNLQKILGMVMAMSGLVWLVLPGIEAPPAQGAILMTIAGTAWGVYSIIGRPAVDPTVATAVNFRRAALPAILLAVACLPWASWDLSGCLYAVLSGSIASGLGYVIWYKVLPSLKAASASSFQLSVPLIAAFGGVIFLDETLSIRFAVSALLILGGIVMVLRGR